MDKKEIQDKFHISSKRLSLFERMGVLSLNTCYNDGNHDIKRLQLISCMNEAGLSIDVIKRYIDLLDLGEHTFLQRKALLIEQREILSEQGEEKQRAVALLDKKLNCYQLQ